MTAGVMLGLATGATIDIFGGAAAKAGASGESPKRPDAVGGGLRAVEIGGDSHAGGSTAGVAGGGATSFFFGGPPTPIGGDAHH